MGITLKDLVLLFSPNKCILIRVYSKKGFEALVNAKPSHIIENDDIKDTQPITITYNKSESHFIIDVMKINNLRGANVEKVIIDEFVPSKEIFLK